MFPNELLDLQLSFFTLLDLFQCLILSNNNSIYLYLPRRLESFPAEKLFMEAKGSIGLAGLALLGWLVGGGGAAPPTSSKMEEEPPAPKRSPAAPFCDGAAFPGEENRLSDKILLVLILLPLPPSVFGWDGSGPRLRSWSSGEDWFEPGWGTTGRAAPEPARLPKE